MLFARYWVALPVLAIAGSLAPKKRPAAGAGTLPTHTPLFVGVLVGAVVLVGALTFIPALALGPIAEHLHDGRGAGRRATVEADMSDRAERRSALRPADHPPGGGRRLPQARSRATRSGTR